MNILEKLRKMGYTACTDDYYKLADVWQSWYEGSVKKFHTYRVYNGQKRVTCHRYSLGMAKKIAEDWANLLMNEKVVITLEGEREQMFFDEVARQNNFWVKCNELQEIKAGLGAAAYVARMTGVSVDGSGALRDAQAIKFDYVTAGHIFPLSWENGRVIECAFTSDKVVGAEKYLYMQLHHRDTNGNYIISNTLYKNNDGNLSDEIDLATVPGFENVPETVYTGSPVPQFVLDRLNITNNVDMSLPLGVPAFANAIDELKGVDIAYDSYVNEFVLGKKRVMIKPEAVRNPVDDEPYYDPNDVVFYVMPEDGTQDSMIKEIDMSLRTAEHNTGIQDMLNALSAKCGFGENHYRFNSGSIQTATQVISENSTLYRTIKKHEIILEDVLKELVRLVLHLGNQYMRAGLNEEVEISIDFDDSIIEDSTAEFDRDARMVSMGIMNAWEFRAKWMNEDAETAKAALPGMESLVNDPAEKYAE